MLTNDDLDGGPVRRQLWDLGRPLVVLMAPLLTWYANRDKSFVWTVEEVRGHARDWPPSGGDAEMANLFRTQAWLIVAFGPLVVYATASMLRLESSPGSAFLEGTMVVSATVLMFTLGMVLASGMKWALSQYLTPDLDRRLGPPRRREVRRNPRRPGLLVRMCLPSATDVLVALVFAACIAPNVYP